MNVRTLAVFAILLPFMSCVSSPPPATGSGGATAPAASDPYKDRAIALVQGGGDAGSTVPPVSSGSTGVAPTTGTAPATTAADTGDVPPPLPGVLTPEEEAYLNNYLSRLQYMVYYDEKAGIDAQAAKTAVAQANRYLIEKLGLSVVDFDQIEKNKKDQLTAYQAETGGSIDLIQYLAQKYNADVYVELSFTTTTSVSGTRYYATAQGSMKLYDTSTAQLLGTVPFQSPQVMSTASVEAATTAAIATSVWTAMPKMTDQSKALVKGSLSRGIRYEVTIQVTPDSRMVSTLRRTLGKSFREVEQFSYSPSETKLIIYTFLGRDKVEDGVYDAADRAGMPDIYLVFNRGKAFTFNSGL